MNSQKVKTFMSLAGQSHGKPWQVADEHTRKLGAQLLLSETLEYVIKGLGIIPEFNGQKITCPNSLNYHLSGNEPDKEEILDGLCDVAYTMYWNAEAIGVPLEEAFDTVCDNNLEKFVRLSGWQGNTGAVTPEKWHLDREVKWPQEVTKVEVLKIESDYFAVGKDERGKVRKPSSFAPVDLSSFL